MAGTALKITKFFGEAPKISPELLPETVAQYAFNLDLSSGDLLPYRRAEETATLDKVGTIKTIYPLFTPGTGETKWLHWITDVDVATAQIEGDTTQRIYYTGDGAPKVTNYSMATSGAAFPTTSYTLGLPLPTDIPVATAGTFTQKTASTRARDAGGTATIVTTANHELTTGDYVTTTGFAGTGYNLTNIPVTVLTPTSFSYFSFGAAEASTGETVAAKVDLAGVVAPRTYVFTYYTAWEEESVPSEPSPAVFVKEGQSVTITGLPASWTHGAGYQTAGMKVRVYRTVAGVSGTEYYRIAEVTLGTTSVVDDIDVATLDADTILESTDYDQPDPTMQGLLAIHNSMIVGFFGNTVCFSEPGQPHAWPIKYRQQIDAPIVALGAFGTVLLVLTGKTPWTLIGNNPEAQSLARTDFILPCLSKRSVINIGFGVAWASTGGLAVYSTTIGTDYLTKNVHSWNTWNQEVTPTALVGEYYRGRYFGSDGTNTFIFERNDQVGGHLVETDLAFTAAHYIALTDQFYFVSGSDVYLWNSPNVGPTTLDWKSKVFTTKDYINFGAARVIADYSTPEGEAAIAVENAIITAANAALIASGNIGGDMGADDVGVLGVDESRITPLVTPEFTAVFQLFVDKELIYSNTITDDLPFRLPTGYRADTFEIRVATTARVRAIHLAETMAGLKGA